jgi:hypothetical protein
LLNAGALSSNLTITEGRPVLYFSDVSNSISLSTPVCIAENGGQGENRLLVFEMAKLYL